MKTCKLCWGAGVLVHGMDCPKCNSVPEARLAYAAYVRWKAGRARMSVSAITSLEAYITGWMAGYTKRTEGGK